MFAPKYRRKIFHESHRREIMNIIKDLCQWKGIEIIEGEMAPPSFTGGLLFVDCPFVYVFIDNTKQIW